jgi:hypothetical protein
MQTSNSSQDKRRDWKHVVPGSRSAGYQEMGVGGGPLPPGLCEASVYGHLYGTFHQV